ncbi:MAG: HlyC/CorC family transporter [Verrucomicrobiota bacterium]|nr:HlyC/CorC family transporter [Verrucomicrobiota bacterium]
MSPLFFDLLPLFFFFAALFVRLSTDPLTAMGKFRSRELLHSPHPPLFFYYSLLKRVFSKQEWESLLFSSSLARQVAWLGTAFSLLFALHKEEISLSLSSWISIGALFILFSLIAECIAYLIAAFFPIPSLKCSALFSSLYLLLLFPIIAPLFKLMRLFLKTPQLDKTALLMEKGKIREMLRESGLELHLDPTEQQLIASVLHFKGRVAKEIMVPRVDVYALPAEATITETERLFASEGYSRIPIYRDSLDQIVGFVLYKDLLKYHANPERDPEATLQSIAKPVLYAPENKKITQLLQEFRGKQVHMAIIVDEYGGTEGIVTIEDILEELVGEIEDEYDIGEEQDFWQMPGGGWVVDAKMTIHDIEERLGLSLPTHPDYETIGGYIYHCAGTIPPKGWRLSHDAFDLEVLSSTERGIKKVKIVPNLGKPSP